MHGWLRTFLFAIGTAALTAMAVQAEPAQTDSTAPRAPTELTPPGYQPVHNESELVAAIGTCLANNQEAVLFSDHVQCMNYRTGKQHLREKAPNVPFDIDLDRDCPSLSSQPAASPTAFNARRLPASAIDDLAKKYASAPRGIRILGALFCDRLNVIGLDLQTSLVLDRSVFKEGIEIRNFHTRGDFSVDGSLVFKQFRIVRSHFEGSLFGDESFINGLAVIETTIDGSASFRESVLSHIAHFEGTRIARVLSLRASALSFLLTQFSTIGGLLELSHSEARCAYYINKTEIGFLVANHAGFGTVALSQQGSATGAIYAWKRGFTITEAVERTFAGREVKKAVREAESCETDSLNYRAEFFLFDSKVISSLCMNEFQWLSPHDADLAGKDRFQNPSSGSRPYLTTIVALNGNTIGNNLIINLWSSKRTIHDSVSTELHKFEAIGLKAGGFVFNFADHTRNYYTVMDGLQFDRIYSAQVACEYAGSGPKLGDSGDAGTPSIISELKAQMDIPTVTEVLRWLERNRLASTQAYTAFASAFEKAGADSTQIKVARANREVCERAAHWLLLPIIRPFCSDAAGRLDAGLANTATQTSATPANTATQTSATPAKAVEAAVGLPPNRWQELGTALSTIPDALSDLAQLTFRGGLYFLADHGYRPGKVLWWVTLTLIVFWLVFVFRLKVVAFAPKPKNASAQAQAANVQAANVPAANVPDQPKPALRSIGLLFLFDRLLPNYQILTANYDIDQYYRRISRAEAEQRPIPPLELTRLGLLRWPIEPVSDPVLLGRIESALLVLRILGVVFTIFLAAAVGALIVH